MIQADLKALRWAVRMAEDWRGAFVGNPNPFPLRQFDTAIRRAKAALRAAKKAVNK